MHRYAFSLCTFSINTYKLRLTMLLLNFYLKSYATDTCLKLIHVATCIYHGLYEKEFEMFRVERQIRV